MQDIMLPARSGHDPAAIAAHEAEVIGKPQRIEPLVESELNAESLQVILEIRQSIGASLDAPIPEYCLTLAKHPAILRCQMQMGTAVFRGVLPVRDRELAVLRIGWLLRAPYEWGEHIDISKRNGVAPEEIEKVTIGSSAPGWSAHDKAIIKAVEEMLSQQSISDETWGMLATSWNEQQLIEFTMMAGQYVAIALAQNALRIRLEPKNLGLTHR